MFKEPYTAAAGTTHRTTDAMFAYTSCMTICSDYVNLFILKALFGSLECLICERHSFTTLPDKQTFVKHQLGTVLVMVTCL